MRKILSLLAAILAVSATSCSVDAIVGAAESVIDPESSERAALTEVDGLAFVSGEVLVKFLSDASEATREAALAAVDGGVKRRVRTQAMLRSGDPEGITVAFTALDVSAAVAILEGLPSVAFAEPNYIYRHAEVPNDTYYTAGSLWGMYGDATSPANAYGSQAGEAWALGHIGSKTVHIGVIDEGCMFEHSDLAGQIWTNPYDPLDGLDNDGNGYVDDIHGWDFVNDDNTTYDGAADDHGTHVSGTIGAKGGNSAGVVGVNWNISIITAKFLGGSGGTTEDAILAVDYLTDLKLRHGLLLPASSNSWGGGAYSQALEEAIGRAEAADILFIAAAGNESLDIDSTISYPAGYPNDNIIAVAAIDSAGNLASYSNYGATRVDIGAPGSAIYSTVPSKNGKSSTYASYSGTSMATPHVSGGAALYAASHPMASAAEIKAAILGSAIPTASLSGKCLTGGRLDLGGF